MSIRPALPLTLALAFLVLPASVLAQPRGDAGAEPSPATDSTDVVSAIHGFHEALSSGDGDAALGFLADDVHIAESGGLETRAEYQSHHLPGDMAFASAVGRVSTFTSVNVLGDVAWAMSSSSTQGTFREREINSRGAELIVLRRDGDEWKITAIHWSSRQAR